MSASLVGSEMCIRDRPEQRARRRGRCRTANPVRAEDRLRPGPEEPVRACLLYTSDAADDM
eukprot:6198108-Alexandrium_andersonii.AAC.1